MWDSVQKDVLATPRFLVLFTWPLCEERTSTPLVGWVFDG
jgi:hypothetical protein